MNRIFLSLAIAVLAAAPSKGAEVSTSCLPPDTQNSDGHTRT